MDVEVRREIDNQGHLLLARRNFVVEFRLLQRETIISGGVCSIASEDHGRRVGINQVKTFVLRQQHCERGAPVQQHDPGCI